MSKALNHIKNVLGPSAPQCAGCAIEIGEALSVLPQAIANEERLRADLQLAAETLRGYERQHLVKAAELEQWVNAWSSDDHRSAPRAIAEQCAALAARFEQTLKETM